MDVCCFTGRHSQDCCQQMACLQSDRAGQGHPKAPSFEPSWRVTDRNWNTKKKKKNRFGTLQNSGEIVLNYKSHQNRILDVFFFFLLQTIVVSLPHYGNVFTRVCAMSLRCWDSSPFLMMLLLCVNTTFLFKALSSVKEAYRPNPQGSDVLSRSTHTPPSHKLLTRIQMHMMFANLHEN